jgi:hypothetical protein
VRKEEGAKGEGAKEHQARKASKRDTRAYVLVNISTADGSCRNTKIQLLSFVHVLLLSPPLTFENIIFPRR